MGNKRCREIGQLLLQHSQLSGEALDLCLRSCCVRPRQVLRVCGGRGRRGGSYWGSDWRADGCQAEGTQDSTHVNRHPPRASHARGTPSGSPCSVGATGPGGWGRRSPYLERGGSAPGQGEGRAPARGRGRMLRPPLPGSRGGNIEILLMRFIPREHQKGIGGAPSIGVDCTCTGATAATEAAQGQKAPRCCWPPH